MKAYCFEILVLLYRIPLILHELDLASINFKLSFNAEILQVY
jgi:hypothetical protein